MADVLKYLVVSQKPAQKDLDDTNMIQSNQVFTTPSKEEVTNPRIFPLTVKAIVEIYNAHAKLKHFFKCNARILGIEEKGAEFSFSSGGYHQFEDCTGDVYGAIDLNWCTILRNTAEEKVTAGLTVGSRSTEVQIIGVNVECYVRGTAAYVSIWMCRHVVEELIDSTACFFSRRTLLHCNIREAMRIVGGRHGWWVRGLARSPTNIACQVSTGPQKSCQPSYFNSYHRNRY